MPSTRYHVMNGEAEVSTKSKKAQAVSAADAFADENRGVTVTVVTDAGTEVHSVLRKAKGTHAAPWTRVSERLIEELEIPEGFTASYPRMRIPALVCRANDKSGWLIVTPEGNIEAKDTKEAREITNDLGAKAAQARLEAKEAAKQEKARLREEAKATKAEAGSAA